MQKTTLPGLAWICLAGALGTGTRYLVQTWAARNLSLGFPFGTILVNLVGSFAMCLLMQITLTTELLTPTLRTIIATGFLGGLTTYSAFNYDTLYLAEQGLWRSAILNLTLTLVGCGGLGLLGFELGKRLTSR
jgi:CrcB protein